MLRVNGAIVPPHRVSSGVDGALNSEVPNRVLPLSLLRPTQFPRRRSAGSFTHQQHGLIPPGSFTMGSPVNEQDRWSDEGPQTPVRISRGFWMGIYEVTQREYLSLINTNPSRFTGDLNRPWRG